MSNNVFRAMGPNVTNGCVLNKYGAITGNDDLIRGEIAKIE